MKSQKHTINSIEPLQQKSNDSENQEEKVHPMTLKDQIQMTYNKLTCIHTLKPSERKSLTEQLENLEKKYHSLLSQTP